MKIGNLIHIRMGSIAGVTPTRNLSYFHLRYSPDRRNILTGTINSRITKHYDEQLRKRALDYEMNRFISNHLLAPHTALYQSLKTRSLNLKGSSL